MSETEKTFRGVSIEGRRGNNRPWRAQIYINGRKRHIDYFQTFEEAKDARIKAEKAKITQI